MGVFIVGSAVCCLDIFEKCSFYQLQQTFHEVFTMEMSLQYCFTLLDSQPASSCTAVCSLQAFLYFWSERSIYKVAEDTLFHAASPFPLSKQSNFSCPFPVASDPLFPCDASSGPVVNGACIGILSSFCQLKTEKCFPPASSTSLYPALLLYGCLFPVLSFGVNYSQVWVRKFSRKLTCKVVGKDLGDEKLKEQERIYGNDEHWKGFYKHLQLAYVHSHWSQRLVSAVCSWISYL